MSVPEVVLHARRRVVHRADDAAWRRRRSLWRRSWEPSDSRVFRRMPALGAPLGLLTKERAALFLDAVPGERDALLATADRWLGGRVRLLGYPEVTVPLDGDPWRDPFTARSWPDRHGRLLDYRHDAPGDPKWIWELHRRQEVPLLALAWLVSGEERYADGARTRLLGAVSAPGRGIAWANAFEPGVRGLSLA